MDNKVNGLVEVLKSGNTREEAFDYIKANKVSVSVLKQAAKEMEIYVKNGIGKEQLVERIVEATIGHRLCYRALMSK